MKTAIGLPALIILCILLAGVRPARAYVLEGAKWQSGATTIYLGALDPAWQPALTRAMSDWSAATPFQYSSLPDNQGLCNATVNAVGWSSSDCGQAFGSNVLAITEIRWSGGYFLYNTLVFNTAYSWSVYDGPLQPAVDFHRVALHELGHFLGLGHTTVSPAIMQPMISNTYTLQPDDIAGANALYGAGAVCANGATNFPACTACPSGQSMQNGMCSPTPPPPSVSLALAVLPSTRSVMIGTTATLSATAINASTITAGNCQIGIRPHSQSQPGTGTAWDVSLAGAVGPFRTSGASPSVSLAAGARQDFILRLIPNAALAPTEFDVTASCISNGARAVVSGTPISGVNTLVLTASSTPVPDVVALAATSSQDGVVRLAGGTGAFAVAYTNLGSGAAISVSAASMNGALPISTAVCQTDPASGQCTTPSAPQVTATLASGSAGSFAIFVGAPAAIAFAPGTNRIVVTFRDSAGIVRGSTSVAVTA